MVTGTILFVLLFSRILSNYNLIEDVHASFDQDVERGDLITPYVEDLEVVTEDAIISQYDRSKEFSSRTTDLISIRERADRIREFYSKWNSPMADHAEFIVETADHFGIDWRLIPAISIVESSGGVHCFKPYNAFGWGRMSFANFEESIYTVTKGLATRYGSDNPVVIAYAYCPPTAEIWGAKVSNLMNGI
jgi:hypothetical protein